MELSPHCPLCRSPVTPESLLVPPPMLQNSDVIIEGEKLGRSTKVRHLLKHIHQMKNADPTAKCVIFSQWTSFLDILRQPLEEDGIGFVGLDGRMNHQKRKEVMHQFNTDPSVTALLISLKAGGVGLNLTVASVVFLMDPWWNPAGEEQAMDRVHRLGQTKDVKCVRFVIQDSVEERMLKLQEKKRCMVQGAFGKRSIAELQAMRINELKLLFDDGPL